MSNIGDLVIVKTEFTDQSGWKLRPGLIVGEYLNDYLIAFISKQVQRYKSEPNIRARSAGSARKPLR